MALEVGSAYVTILPSARGFGAKLRSQVNSETRGIGEGAGRTFGTGFGKNAGKGMSSGIKSGAAGATSAAGAAGERSGRAFSDRFKSATVSISKGLLNVGKVAGTALAAAGAVGIKTASDNEQAAISFTTMLGSAQKADRFLRDMKKFAAETPFEMQDLQSASSSLISVGVETSKVLPIMRTLGDVTSGMGTGSEGIKRATVALQQMNAAQRITGEDLNQLRDAGIPVYDLLAASTGKSKAEVVKLAQAGKLGKRELDALMKGLETGKGLEKFSGLMEKQSASLAGMMSNLKDTFSQGMADLIEPAMPALKSGVAKVNETLNGAFAWIQAHMPQIKAAVASGVAGITAAFSQVQSNGALDSIKAAFSSINWTDVGTNLGAVGAVITSSLGPGIDILKTAGDALGSVFQFLSEHSGVLKAALIGLAGAFVVVKTAQAANAVIGRDSVIGFGLQLASNVALVASNMALARSYDSAAAAQGRSTAASTGGMLARVRETAATVASRVATVAMAAAQRAAAAGQWLLNAALSANPIASVIVAITALVAGLVWFFTQTDTGRAIVTAAWNGIKAAMAGVVSWFNSTALPLLSAGWAKLKAAGSALKAALGVAWNGIKAAVSVVASAVGGYVRTLVSGFKGLWAAGQTLKTRLGEAWNGVKGAVNTAKTTVSEAIGSMTRTFDNLKDGVGRVVDAVIGKWREMTDFVSSHVPSFSMPSMPDFSFLGRGVARASGGILPGYTPGKDVHHFVGPAGGLSLSGGEAIMRPEWTAAMGPGYVHRMNAAARSGGVGGVRREMGFAKGGVYGEFAAGGITPGPAAVTSRQAALIRKQLSKQGKRYVWGASHTPREWNNPAQSAFDCSGFEQWGLTQIGIAPRGAVAREMGRAAHQIGLARAAVTPGAFLYSNSHLATSLGTGNATIEAMGSKWGVRRGKVKGRSFTGGSIDPRLLTGGKLSDVGAASFKVTIGKGGGGGSSSANSELSEKPKPVTAPTYRQMAQLAATQQINQAAQSLTDAGAASAYAAMMSSSTGRMVNPLAVETPKAKAAAAKRLAAAAKGSKATKGTIKELAKAMSARRGWTGKQWSALDWIVNKESKWDPDAKNPRSSAYGLFQFLNGTWGSTGIKRTSDPQKQIEAGLKYIGQRYKTPVGAKSFWQKHKYYADGGVYPSPLKPKLYDTGGTLSPGLTLVSNQTGKPETVRTYEQEQHVQKQLNGGGNIIINSVKNDSVPELVDALEFALRRRSSQGRYSRAGV